VCKKSGEIFFFENKNLQKNILEEKHFRGRKFAKIRYKENHECRLRR
jgi:hypothetical protein